MPSVVSLFVTNFISQMKLGQPKFIHALLIMNKPFLFLNNGYLKIRG